MSSSPKEETSSAGSFRHPCFTCTIVGDAEGCPLGVTGLPGMDFEGVLLPEEGGTKPWQSLSLAVCLAYHAMVTIENHDEKRE